MDSREGRIDLATVELPPCKAMDLLAVRQDLSVAHTPWCYEYAPDGMPLLGSLGRKHWCTRPRGHDGPHAFHMYTDRRESEQYRWFGSTWLSRVSVLRMRAGSRGL